MTEQAGPVIDVIVTLPDDWWVIPLIDSAARDASIDVLIDRQFAGITGQLLLRSEMVSALRAQATRAAENSGRLLALSRQHVGGIPIAASLVVSWIDLTTAEGSPLVELRDGLLPDPSLPLPPGEAIDSTRLPIGPVLRRVHTTEAEHAVQSLVVDYWLERPDRTGLAHFAFGTPMLPVREQMLELFDAVVSAVRWVHASV